MSDDFNFFVNYECTSATNHFFREVGEPFSFVVRPLTLSAGLTYWTTVNNSNTKYDLTETLTFTNSESSVQTITLHCSSLTPQVDLSRSISAIFLQHIPSVDYVSWPMYYIPDSTRIIKLSASNYLLSQSLSFYGEGHTDKINFQAASPTEGQYTWYINGSSTINTTASSAYVVLSSTPGVSALLPVECKITNQHLHITSSSPSYFYNDLTGEKTLYPYFYSTSNNSKNNNYKQSVHIKTYSLPSNTLTHNSQPPIIINSGELYPCDFSFQYAPREDFLDECFGKYGEVWKWSTFTESDSALPCTWTSLKTNVSNNTRLFFNKKWYKEDFDTVSYVRSPIVQTLSTISWRVEASQWRFSYPGGAVDFSVVGADNFKNFSMPLCSFNNNLDNLYIVSSEFNTPLTITLSAQFVSKMVEYSGVVYDWEPRLHSVQHVITTYTYPMPSVLLYASNKYVLKSQ
jgi:hypothetical protein